MSKKYNPYARRLERAFLKAREEYAAAADKLTKAEQRKADANRWHEEKYVGQRELEKAKAQAAYLEAKAEFDRVADGAWANFSRERDRLTAELREAVRADNIANADSIDGNALELLKSGVMNADDYSAMLAKFDGNSTMTRLIGKYAADTSKTVQDRNEQARLNIIANTARNGESAVMRSWNELSETANILSGQAHGKGERGYTQAMNSRWEELASPAVEDF